MINIIKTALNSATHKIGVVTNNIANASTNGFKRSEAIFEDMYMQATSPVLPGSGSTVNSNRVIHHPGNLKRTGVSTDIAINGHGMLMFAAPEALEDISFSRNGSLKLNNNGFLTSNDGQFVLSKDGTPIQIEYEKNGIPLSQFNINPQGFVMTAYGVGAPEPGEQVGLAYFDNPSAMEQLGNGRFLATPDASLFGIFTPGENGTGELRSGNLEVSNVDLVSELVLLINSQQAFSAASKAIQADNDMIAKFTK